MRLWVFILLLPFNLLAQETYDNCFDIPQRTYQVDYSASKEYYWWVSAGDIVISNNNTLVVQWPDSIGTYTISVSTTSFGCLGDTSRHTVTIKDCEYIQLFFPNSFTPNGDNHNEVYQIEGRASYRIIYMSIYNRWGERIFEADSNLPWDGKNCQVGLYTINVLLKNQRFTRSILLVR